MSSPVDEAASIAAAALSAVAQSALEPYDPAAVPWIRDTNGAPRSFRRAPAPAAAAAAAAAAAEDDASPADDGGGSGGEGGGDADDAGEEDDPAGAAEGAAAGA